MANPMLTDVELARFLRLVAGYWTAHGYGPAIRDLRVAGGYSSNSVVQYRVQRCIDEGLLTHGAAVDIAAARSLRLTEVGTALLARPGVLAEEA